MGGIPCEKDFTEGKIDRSAERLRRIFHLDLSAHSADSIATAPQEKDPLISSAQGIFQTPGDID